MNPTFSPTSAATWDFAPGARKTRRVIRRRWNFRPGTHFSQFVQKRRAPNAHPAPRVYPLVGSIGRIGRKSVDLQARDGKRV